MSCIAIHVDAKATEFEIAMKISFLMIFLKTQLQQTITAFIVVNSFIHLLYFLNISRKSSLFQSSFIRILIFEFYCSATLIARQGVCNCNRFLKLTH